MAQRDRASANDNSPASSGGRAGSFFAGATAAVSKLWHALTDDGHLAAAGRQGIDELGTALKAFPDSIQTQETGTIWNPTQGEIAAERQHTRHRGGPPHPWPSEIASQNRYQPGNDHGDDHDHGHSL
jgi:hypothetical protein